MSMASTDTRSPTASTTTQLTHNIGEGRSNILPLDQPSPSPSAPPASPPHSDTSSSSSTHLNASSAPSPATTEASNESSKPGEDNNDIDEYQILIEERAVSPSLIEAESSTLSEQPAESDGDWQAEGDEADFLQDLRRVKVYELIGSKWTDRGTAFCTGDYDDVAQVARLVAKSEQDQEVLLRTTIKPQEIYQRQQETLIVWTEDDGRDFALSFQDQEGCNEVWDFIIEVQRHLQGKVDEPMTSSPSNQHQPSVSTIISSGRLPDPQLGIIPEIDRAIKLIARNQISKERVCEYIVVEDYLKLMIELSTQAEDLESLDDLHALCSCTQTILTLNDHGIYEYVLQDEIFFGVMGMLEYDPDFPTFKASYREFLSDVSRYRHVVPFYDPAMERRIHSTYRLQFLRDVVLARVLDDPTFNIINSLIVFNQIDIITYLQTDARFHNEVLGPFMDPIDLPIQVPPPKPKEVGKDEKPAEPLPPRPPPQAPGPKTDQEKSDCVAMLQHLCIMAKNVQLPARLALFRNLVDRGILYAVQWALGRTSDKAMLDATGDMISILLEHDVSGVRGHIMKQVERASSGDQSGITFRPTLLAEMTRMLASSQDLALKSQMTESLRTLMDVPGSDGSEPAIGIKALIRVKEDPGTEKFLDYFYGSCANPLFKPLIDLPEFKHLNEPRLVLTKERSNLYLYLCDLLCSFSLQHAFRSHYFVLSSNISSRVATLLRAREKHLRLVALRFFRICLRLNNRNLFTHLMKHDVFSPILDLSLQESKRDNLLSSSCQEFFEHIRRENIKDLIEHVMKHHEPLVRKLAETPIMGTRFQGFIRRWEMNIEPAPKVEETQTLNGPGLRRWGQGRLMEAEEEDYFNASDEEEGQPPWGPRGAISAINTSLKRKRGKGVSRSPRPQNVALPRALPLASLVDYFDDDDTGGSNPAEADRSPTNETSVTIAPPPSEDSQSPLVRAPQPLKHAQVAPNFDAHALAESPDSAMSEAGPSMLSLRASEKRRRDDEDDEMLERLATKGKRPALGADASKAVSKQGGKEEGTKKIKVKFGATSLAMASASPESLDPGVPPSPPIDNSPKVGGEG